MTFELLIDDHGHYQDNAERRSGGDFERYEDAVAAAIAIVDQFLLQHRDQYDCASTLFDVYCHYGEDPFIVPDPGAEHERFSARDYARCRCQQLYANGTNGNRIEWNAWFKDANSDSP